MGEGRIKGDVNFLFVCSGFEDLSFFLEDFGCGKWFECMILKSL